MIEFMITYFQDKEGWDRVKGKKCFCDDYSEVSLTSINDIPYIESWNIEIVNFLNFKINVAGMNEQQVHRVLDTLI